MTLTLREEVLKNSGLLTEEILEEGALKKALITAAVIAGLGGAVIGGGKLSKEVKQYNSVKDKPIATRYAEADAEVNKDIKDKEYASYTGNNKVSISPKSYNKLKYVKSINSEYNDRNHQAVLNIYVNDASMDELDVRTAENEIKQALGDYVKYLEKNYSGLENRINEIKQKEKFNTVPLKVVIHCTKDGAIYRKFYGSGRNLEDYISACTGSQAIEYKNDYNN